MPSDNSKPSFLEWLRGKRNNDINLPAEPGSEHDPRLERPNVMEQMEKAGQGLNSILNMPSMQALKDRK